MSSKGTSVYCKSNVQINYSWAWGTCFILPLSLSCCGWQCTSRTSVVSLMCSVLPWRVTKLSVLSRWHWMCCIVGKRCCARAWFSWKLSSPSWNNFISQQLQLFLLGDPRYSQFVFRSEEPRAPSPGWEWGGWGSRTLGSTSPACVLSPQKLLSSLRLWREIFSLHGSPLPPEPLSRADFSPPLQLQAGCCWADAEAARRRWPQSRPLALGVPGWSRPAHRAASAGKEAHTAEAGKVPWGLALSKNPPSLPSFFCPLLTYLSLPFQLEPLEGFLTACSVFFQRYQELGCKGEDGHWRSKGLSARLPIMRLAFWLSVFR